MVGVDTLSARITRTNW